MFSKIILYHCAMQIGVFAKIFQRPSVEETFDAVRTHDVNVAQFNMSCVGLSSMPDAIPSERARRVGAAAAEREIEVAAVSGTFNMIHPDVERREGGLRRLEVLAEACEAMGTSVITLCTGTRDPDDKWLRHPENDTVEAQEDLWHMMERALRVAEDHDVTLAFEPEVANVINTAEKGRRLLDDMNTPHLRVVFDPANLFETAPARERKRLVEEGLDLLGEDVVIAHAKDRRADGAFCPAGRGVLDYGHYLSELRSTGFDGPLVLHGLEEEEVAGRVQFLRDELPDS